VQPELGVNASDVNTHRVETDPEPAGNGLGFESRSNEQRDLELAGRQDLDGVGCRQGGTGRKHVVALAGDRQRSQMTFRTNRVFVTGNDDTADSPDEESRNDLSIRGRDQSTDVAGAVHRHARL